MANWTDGPEYAPLERPAAFETPAVAPLETPAPPVHPAPDAPAARPDYAPPPVPVPPLVALVPGSGPARDPLEAFATTQSALTAGSAWGAAHALSGGPGQPPTWTPEQPLVQSAVTTVSYPPPATGYPPPHVNPSTFPQPGTVEWFTPPPSWAPPQPTPQPVTISQMWAAATPGVIIPLLIGAFVPGLPLIMIALSFSLSARVTHRRRQIRWAYGIAAAILVLVGAFSLLDDTLDASMVLDIVSGWAQWACWILPVVIMVIVGAGLRAGEPPERPF